MLSWLGIFLCRNFPGGNCLIEIIQVGSFQSTKYKGDLSSLTVRPRSYGLTVTDNFLTVKSNVYMVQKTVLSDSLDCNAKVINRLCENPIASKIRKKVSQVSLTNESQHSLIRGTTVIVIYFPH